jgi:hypothetical protein
MPATAAKIDRSSKIFTGKPNESPGAGSTDGSFTKLWHDTN